MASSIGIKIANGEFYPIMEENSSVKKRLILTTVHDNQPSVQIDLYRSVANTMADAQYIGSLVIENIQAKPKGEPSIEMVISSNADGDIVADAMDLDTGSGGEHYVLTVSLKSLDETARDMELPDFELESNDEPPSSLYSNKVQKEKKRTPLWLIILLIVLLILGFLAAWLFFMGGLERIKSKDDGIKTEQQAREPVKEEPKIEPVKEPEPVRVVEAEKPPQPAPVIQAPAEPPAPRPKASTDSGRKRPAPVHSYNVPATIPREGVNYTIRWGDTLWDIADAFYRDPWQYPRIARFNNISNPDLIISGRTIKVPPRN